MQVAHFEIFHGLVYVRSPLLLHCTHGRIMRKRASEHKPDVGIRIRLCVSQAVLCNCAADYSSFRPFSVVINF